MDEAMVWVKRSPRAPEGFFTAEAAGLTWLAKADALPVVAVREVEPQQMRLERLESVEATESAARDFGAGLSRLHASGAPAFGALAPGAGTYFFGPLESPLTLPSQDTDDVGRFYAEQRLTPLVELCAADGSLSTGDLALITRLVAALGSGALTEREGTVVPARVHGDLWNGNIIWTRRGATLIDPAACGHHPWTDLAMLTMFGAPHLEAILEGYETAAQLPPNWRASLGLHQLFAHLVHLHLFGRVYLPGTQDALRSAADYLGL